MNNKYLYFWLSGGEYHDDLVGVVEITPEFKAFVERGRKAVEACREVFQGDAPRLWFGTVCALGGWYDALKCTDEEELRNLYINGYCFSDKAPPPSTEEGFARLDSTWTHFDYVAVRFVGTVKHVDHEYISCSVDYTEILWSSRHAESESTSA